MERVKRKSENAPLRGASSAQKAARVAVAGDPAGARGRLYQELARALQAAIESGRYKKGQRLPAERDLAVEYKVSRPTVREAVIALEVRGVVEVRLGSGTYVRRVQGSADSPAFNVTAFELTEARLLFEGEAAALAATLITDEELQELEALLRQIERENQGQDNAERADREFHLLIARATRNQAIEKTIDDLWQLRSASPECALLLAKARAAQVKPVVAEHKRILRALSSRDPEQARAAMRSHLGAVMDHLLFTTEEHAIAEARRSVQTTKARFRRSATS
jgi:DNA-binding FadR family transcriptional regulator